MTRGIYCWVTAFRSIQTAHYLLISRNTWTKFFLKRETDLARPMPTTSRAIVTPPSLRTRALQSNASGRCFYLSAKTARGQKTRTNDIQQAISTLSSEFLPEPPPDKSLRRLLQPQPDTIIGYLTDSQAAGLRLQTAFTADEETALTSFTLNPTLIFPFLRSQWKSATGES
jgi:hypothetical protein